MLERRRTRGFDYALAAVMTALALYVAAAVAPFLSFRLSGNERTTTLFSMPTAFTAHGMPELTWLVLGTAVLAPLAKLSTTAGVLLGLRQHPLPPWVPTLARWRVRIGPWAMTEVFLLGVFVAYTRLGALAYVEVGPALYALGGLMLATVATDALLDEEALWEAVQPAADQLATARPAAPQGRAFPVREVIACDTCGLVSHGRPGDVCPRCGAGLRHRRPNALNRSWALLLTAAVLYIPANLYPVLTVIRLGQGGPATILGGAQELLDAGMWPLALLVFVASILVPMLKLVGLTILLVSVRRRWGRKLRDRTRLYRLVDVIGRWSMIDVFMTSVLVSLVDYGTLANVLPGTGVVCFAGVVVLTMLAAASFDPRLMWDAAGRNAPAPALPPPVQAGAAVRPAVA